VRIDAIFLPDHLDMVPGRDAVVIDVLRGTTTALALLEAGASEVLLAGDLDEGRRLKAARGALLVGEVPGRTMPAPGCDLGPSPVGLAAYDLRGRRVVLCTTNGTLAVLRAHGAGAPAVLLACLGNLGAVAGTVLDGAASEGRDLVVVCAGRRGGRRPALDDAFTAGLLVDRLLGLASARGIGILQEDGAVAVRRLAGSYASPLQPLEESGTGRLLVEEGLAADVPWCARLDWSRLVPVARPEPEGIRLVAAGAPGPGDAVAPLPGRRTP
jgi:2-phosphosulfolactate phosphatase